MNLGFKTKLLFLFSYNLTFCKILEHLQNTLRQFTELNNRSFLKDKKRGPETVLFSFLCNILKNTELTSLLNSLLNERKIWAEETHRVLKSQ